MPLTDESDEHLPADAVGDIEVGAGANAEANAKADTDADTDEGATSSQEPLGRPSQHAAHVDDDGHDGHDAVPDVVATPEASPWVPRVGRLLVLAGVAVIFWKIGGVARPGGGTAKWQPWTWRPGPLFRNTTTTGGDTGAHVWAPPFVRDHLLASLRPTGWTKDWYAGFPVLHFYFPAPTWAIALLSFVMPANVAFKLITVAGIFSLPFSAMLFARLAGLRTELRYLFGIGAIVFLLDPHFDILGGNILSTMAGEFSFTISLSAGLTFLGLLIRVLRTGKGRAPAAVLLAVTALSHLLPTIFIAASAVVVILTHLPMRTDRAGIRTDGTRGAGPGVGTRIRRLSDVVLVGLTGTLLAAFWIVPFYAHLDYTNDMGWERTTTFVGGLFPPLADPHVTGAAAMGTVVVLALLGGLWQFTRFAVALLRNREPDAHARVGTTLLSMMALAAAAFRFTPQFRLWNERALPFYFATASLLAGFGLLGAAACVARVTKRRAPATGLVATGALCWWGIGSTLGILPGWMPIPKLDGDGLRVQRVSTSEDRSAVPDWSVYNYEGYEALDDWGEYRQIMDTMARLGRTNGCGRAMWDYEDELDRYGTSMGMMLLPKWTNGCIGSMEGLYFESSATAPYHFLNAAWLSAKPSNAQRNLPYQPLDVQAGVKRLQQWGVRYYMAFAPAAQAQARANADLRLLATSPYKRECEEAETKDGACPSTWEVYEVADAELVAGLPYQPAVVRGVGQSQTGGWLDVAVLQYMNPTVHPVPFAADGPKEWERVTAEVRELDRVDRTYGAGTTVTSPAPKVLARVGVSGIVHEDGKIAFRVDRVGVPVVVKESYFPNWRASGAKGPWRLAPNMMVVIPTRNDVTLRFRRDAADWLGVLLTIAGIGLVIGLRRRDKLRASGPGGATAPESATVAESATASASALPPESGTRPAAPVEPEPGPEPVPMASGVSPSIPDGPE